MAISFDFYEPRIEFLTPRGFLLMTWVAQLRSVVAATAVSPEFDPTSLGSSSVLEYTAISNVLVVGVKLNVGDDL